MPTTATFTPPPAAGLEAPRQHSDGERGLSRTKRSDLTAQLLSEIADCQDTAKRDELLGRVVLINRGVAEAVAARYRNRGVAQEDLQQVAYEGLTKAVNRFDHTLRNDLLTYAVPTIRGEIQRYFRDQGWTVRPPRRVQELQWRVNHSLESLSQELGHEPQPADVMDQLDISKAEYDEAIKAFGCFQPTSLDQSAGKESTTSLGEMLAEADDQQEASEARVTLAPVVRQLSERDRRILHLRFFEDLTQEEIGNDLGVTQMQVSRLLARILRQLRDDLADPGPARERVGERWAGR